MTSTMTSTKTSTKTLMRPRALAAAAAVAAVTLGGGMLAAPNAGAVQPPAEPAARPAAQSAAAAEGIRVADTRCGNDSINPRDRYEGLPWYYLVPGTKARVDTRQVNLYQGKENISPYRQYAFAQITADTQGTRASDRVWMDVDYNGDRRVDHQCGPFSVDTAGTTGFTRAKPTSSDSRVAMRACGDYVAPGGGRRHTCGPWW
jgi:hypothetical protein